LYLQKKVKQIFMPTIKDLLRSKNRKLITVSSAASIF